MKPTITLYMQRQHADAFKSGQPSWGFNEPDDEGNLIEVTMELDCVINFDNGGAWVQRNDLSH